MKKRIVLAVLLLTLLSFVACADNKSTVETSAPTEMSAATTAPVTTVTEPVSTTFAASTTKAETTTEIVTTTEKPTATRPETTKATTTKPTTTKQSATLLEFDPNKPADYYKVVEKAFREDLRYGVYRRRSITNYIETLSNGKMYIVKQDIVEYYNRTLYRASLDDLLPAAKENKEIYSEAINIVISTVNGYRAAEGLKPLKLDSKLTEIACARAEEIAWSGNHTHRRPNGRSCFTILTDAGITEGVAGENIGWGYDSASDVCKAWKESQTHYENIMNPEFTKIGIGVAADPDPEGKLCWAQIFISE